MSGRRGKNLRSGDLAEELGILLLKGIAAVAEAPRPEDIGFDGVATLLREDESGLLYAEDSFYVQFKSASVPSVTYEGHEAEWLMNLKLPLFIGSVNSKNSTISLYTTFRLSQTSLECTYPVLSLHMHETVEIFDSKGERSLNIGPPLLTWGFEDLQSTRFRQTAFEMLKVVIRVDASNLVHRNIKYMNLLNWTTNEAVSESGVMMAGSKAESETAIILEAMAPHVNALMTKFIDMSDKMCVI